MARVGVTIKRPMDFRSHLSRPMDFKSMSNLALAAVCLVTAAIAALLWLGGESGTVMLSPVYAFLVWALVREIDPDHNWTALAAAAFTAAWALLGEPILSGFAIGGLMVAARIVTSTTGRRPLLVDLTGVTVFGVVIGYGVAGWVAGFGIAIAIYLDNRLSRDNNLAAVAAAAITAIGTTVVATAANSFPERLPDIVEWVTIATGLAALILIARDPAPPLSQVDARHAAFIDGTRLHISRSLVACLAFVMSLVTGQESTGLLVVMVAMGLVVVSNELELLRRRHS